MIHTFPSTLNKWAASQEQTADFARAYDQYVQYQTDKPLHVLVPVYGGEVEMKIHFHEWEQDYNGTLYLAFITRKGGNVHRRPVGTLTIVRKKQHA